MKMVKRTILLSIFLTATLIFSLVVRKNVSLKTSNVKSGAYAYYNLVQPDEEKIDGTDYVTFDVFFLSDEDNDEEAEGYRGATILNGTKDKLYLDLKVNGNVTLKDATITFDSSNVTVSGFIPRGSISDTSTFSDDFTTVDLKDVSNGVTSFFYLDVKTQIDKDLNKYNGTNKVILDGTVVDNTTGDETVIHKEVSYDVDSYSEYIGVNLGKTEATVDMNSLKVTYEINVYEHRNAMPLNKSIITGSVSDLKGIDPISVNIINGGNDNYTFTYDEQTRQFRAEKTAVINGGVITQSAYNTKLYGSRNTKWLIEVEYPFDQGVYGETATLTASAWYEGIINGSYETVDSEKLTTVLSAKLDALVESTQGFTDNSTVSVGSYISSTREYFIDKTPIFDAYINSEGAELIFNQKWEINSQIDSVVPGKARYTDDGITLGYATDFTNYVSYKSIKVTPNSSFFSYRDTILNIIDADTGDTLFVIKQGDLNKKLEFPDNVHRIIILTNDLPVSKNIEYTVNFEREVNVQKVVADFNQNDFATYTNVVAGFTATEVPENQGSLSELPHRTNATFNEKISIININADPSAFERQVSDNTIHLNLTVTPDDSEASKKTWKKGIALIKFPAEFISLDNIELPDTGSNTAYKFESIEQLVIDNQNFIKIIFTLNEENNLPIELNLDAIINPRSSNISSNIEVYGINVGSTVYSGYDTDIYDIDNDDDTTERVAHATKAIQVIAPNELLTGSTISDFDTKGSVVTSPLIADVDPTRGSSSATMNVFVQNNSQNKVKNLVILGKTGYVGNTYQIGVGDLGTEFDSYMSGPIVVPQSLQSDVEVYYSTREIVTSDLTDPTNLWVQDPADYSLIKSYMIKFDSEKELDVHDTYDFSYPIVLPQTTDDLDKVSYFTHGAYFDYVTSGGNYSSWVSGSKLGVRISRLYNLELDLTKAYSSAVPVRNASFTLTDNHGDVRYLVTNKNGVATLKNLYVGYNYTLKQTGTPSDYVIDNATRTFTVENDTNDDLDLNSSYNYKYIDFYNNTVYIELENETLYKLDLHNTDVETNEDIKFSVFTVTGPNHENGTVIRTDEFGHAYLDNMVLGQDYHVVEESAYGYVLLNEFDTRLMRDPSTDEIALTTRQKPTFIKGNCSNYISVNSNVDGSYDITTDPALNAEEMDMSCLFYLPLQGRNDDYVLSGDASIYDVWNSSANSTLTISLSTNMPYASAAPFMQLQKGATTNSYSAISYSINKNTAYTYDLDNIGPTGPNLKEVPIKGGDTYFLNINYHRSGNDNSPLNPSLEITDLKLESTTGKDELYYVNEKSNVVHSDNSNIIQTVLNYSVDSENKPILKLDVKNKVVDQVPFEVVARDATGNNNILEGAQFKITGPGLPSAGKILTTDNTGKASTNLYVSYTGYINNLPEIASNPNYPLSSIYTIEQIYPATGYTISSNKIIFKLSRNIDDLGNISKEFNYASSITFDDTDVSDGNKFIGYIDNYPIFKATKKDAETNEVLPNAYYSIYSFNRDTLESSPAIDIYGNIIGSKNTIDGVDYYIVKTDENGEFSLELPTGDYKLVEVKASDDKYDITNQVTYFSVGEGKAAKVFKGQYVNGTYLDSGYEPYNTFTRIAKTMPTSDGGSVAIIKDDNGMYTYLVKYDSNYNKVWQTSALQSNNKYYGIATYFDDPDRIDIIVDAPSTNPNTQDAIITEENDAYYVFVNQSSAYKINKTTGAIISTSLDSIKNGFVYYYPEICDKEDGVNYSSFQLINGDDEHVYCNNVNTNVNNTYSMFHSFDSNNNGYILLSNYGNFGLSNGSVYTNPAGYNGYYILKFNNNNEFVDVVPLSSTMINNALANFISTHNVTLNDTISLYQLESNNTKSPIIKYLDDNSIVIIASGTFQYDNAGTTFTMSFGMKILPNGTVDYIAPIGFYGGIAQQLYYGNRLIAYINDDGSFNYYDEHTQAYISGDSSYHRYPITEGYSYTHNLPEEDTAVHYLYEFDSNGELSNVLEMSRPYRRVDGRTDTISNTYRPSIIAKTNGGYIIGEQYKNTAAISKYVILKDGTRFDFNDDTDSFILYKINNDSTVEWVKQYTGIYIMESSSDRYYGFTSIKDGRLVVSLPSDNFDILDNEDNTHLSIKNLSSNNASNILTFNIIDEALPESISTVDLELQNVRKEFKISATSNTQSGTFTINQNNVNVYDGKKPGSFETVKYGDNSISEIVITPDSGYYVKNVTVNGVKTTYSIASNGVVTLDTLTDIKTDKDIYVEFERSSAKVVVHYYLNNTTTKVADDEIIAGRVGDNYTTNPASVIGYELLKDVNDEIVYPVNRKGIFTVNDTEVIYYYDLGDAELVVNYYEKDTDNALLPTSMLKKKLGSSYQTSPANILSYTLNSIVGNESGLLNSPSTEVTYFYAGQKKVTTRYVDIDTGLDVATEIEDYYDVGDNYSTLPLQTPPLHYEYVSVTGTPSGVVGDDDIVVVYNYRIIKHTVTTKYINLDTGLDLATETVDTYDEGMPYSTSGLSPIPEHYEFVRVEGDVTGNADSDIVVTYYYQTIKYKVYTRYVDVETNLDIIPQLEESYNEGEGYTTHKLATDPQYYDYVRVEGTESGTVNSDVTVIYYYQRQKINVTTKYIDVDTGLDVSSQVVNQFNKGGEYTTSPLATIPAHYEYASNSGNTSGTSTVDVIVTYYYQREALTVTTKYLDVETNEPVHNEKVDNYRYGDPYSTSRLATDPEYYDYDSVNGSESGTVDENKVVTYYYQRQKINVTTRYVDKDTNLDITPQDVSIFNKGGDYTTSPLATIPAHYEYVSNSGNTSGTSTVDVIVTYYYQREALTVTTRFIDIETNEPVKPEIVDNYKYGDPYTVTKPTIDPEYYDYASVDGSESGTLNGNKVITYYYLHQKINVTTKYVDLDTNQEVATSTNKEFNKAGEYTTSPLKELPKYYKYVNSTSNATGTSLTDVVVTYYYQKQKGKVVTKYLDIDTNKSISKEYEEEMVYGTNYIAHKLDNIPDNYKLLKSPEKESGVLESDLVELIYYYGINKGKVIIKFIDIDTKEDIKPPVEKIYNFGDTYNITKLTTDPENYAYSSVIGDETGIVDKDEIVITYNYKYIEPEKEETKKPNNPGTSDNIKLYFILLGISIISLVTIVATKKIRKKK